LQPLGDFGAPAAAERFLLVGTAALQGGDALGEQVDLFGGGPPRRQRRLRRVGVDWVLNGYSDDGGPELALSTDYAVRPFLVPYRVPPVDHARPIYAVERQGRVYVSDAATYEVVAFAATGEVLWALSAEVDAPRVLDSDIEAAMRSARPGFEFTRDAFAWPEYFPTLFFMLVDGHGHLYVYRWMRRSSDSAVMPVDVFSEDGEHLFSGTIDRKRWLVGNGDLVYGFDEDEGSGGSVVVAYRLEEPFE
jgi:hypothetical protein